MKNLIIGLLVTLSYECFGQIILSNTTHTLELETTSTSVIDYKITYFDETSGGAGITTSVNGEISTATTTTVLSAPPASTSRTIIYFSIVNTGSADNVITIKVDVAGSEYDELKAITLKATEGIYFNQKLGWTKPPVSSTDCSGQIVSFGKVGTAADAAGYWYGYWKDNGITGAWRPGTPGVGGRTTLGTSSTDAGCIFFNDAAAGKKTYITSATFSASVASGYSLFDVLWVNSGIVVTTTTAQTINSVALPARDVNNSINGEGCRIGVYATAALGNAAVVSNSTISYTNSAGVSGRTATLSATVPYAFPATPVIGTVVWFILQDGDIGVKSIQSITLNTSLTSGSLSVFIARLVVPFSATVANMNFTTPFYGGYPISDGACLLPFANVSTTTASTINGTLTSTER